MKHTRQQVIETLRQVDEKLVLFEDPQAAFSGLHDFYYKNRVFLEKDLTLASRYDEVYGLVSQWEITVKYNRSKLSKDYLQKAVSRNMAKLEQDVIWKILSA